MAVDTSSAKKSSKQLFNFRPPNSTGLLLRIHHQQSPRGSLQRFTTDFNHVAFNRPGDTLAIANRQGGVFLFSLRDTKYWLLRRFNAMCTALTFPAVNDSHLIVALEGGSVYVIDTQNGAAGGIVTILKIKESVRGVVGNANVMVTWTASTVCVWDSTKYTKLHAELKFEDESAPRLIRAMHLMPVTGHIFGYCGDHDIHVWDARTFQPIKLIDIRQSGLERFRISSLAFTRNGLAMVVGGSCAQLAVYFFDVWAVVKIITIKALNKSGVQTLEFVSMPFDGGSNRILAVLAKTGTVLFYNMEADEMVHEIPVQQYQISRLAFSPDSKHFATLMGNGEINLYSTNTFIMIKESTKKCLRSSRSVKSANAKDATLDTEQLRAMLKVEDQYPELYRAKIWAHVLQLSHNVDYYERLMTGGLIVDFDAKFPLADNRMSLNLKNLLGKLTFWCPFLATVDYLPNFVFPFLSVFKYQPALCFEAMCTIIVNWCQFWFEYHPLPPVNVLAMIEIVFVEHDADLLKHLNHYNVTSKMYAWTLLETGFSEVLSAGDWLMFWDHVLTNHPAFLLYATIAYNITFRKQLMSLGKREQILLTYSQPQPINCRLFIGVIYKVMKSVSGEKRIEQFLEDVKPIDLELNAKMIHAGSVVPKLNMDFSSRTDPKCSEISIESQDDADAFRASIEKLRLDELKEYLTSKDTYTNS